MEFLLTIIIFLIILIINVNLKAEPIYRDSPADPNYTATLITITFIFNEIPGSFQLPEYSIKDTFYILKNMYDEDICNYIIKHKELYTNDLKKIQNQLMKKYKKIPSVNKIIIKINGK